MGTPAMIGVVDLGTGDYRGRRVQFDGYGRGVGAELSAIVTRDGLETAIRVLIEDHRYWVSLHSNLNSDNYPPCGRSLEEFPVAGYGVAVNIDCVQWIGKSHEWVTGNVNDGLAIYDYLFAGTGDHAELWAQSPERFHRVPVNELDAFDWELFDHPESRDAEVIHTALTELRNHASGLAPFSEEDDR